ncbi:pyridoxal-phosphate dependent enzyme [Roseibium sediminicola]|uniref:Pyridoxal-phosphate dependent enzyme n=1 Tax=Roseibium sediminicola TaxID=2933272 RepID=A0ABT0GSN8_9HYPH|nr:pyridoxal-phosphate dependent enzyme [Roseibium sp. CAU 1639]MCK7612451.1 pyridoxal-phosphate dependent enzyme [Roseibium sp. CAU 1639]
MDALKNVWLGKGLPDTAPLAEGTVSEVAVFADAFLERSTDNRPTPLLDLPVLATELGIAALSVKDERYRMGLGSFKALGAAYAIAKRAGQKVEEGGARDLATALQGMTFACASAGNHGLSLAAGAPLFGAKAVVFVSETVPEAFTVRLQLRGAKVVRAGATYEDSMAEAQRQAEEQGWVPLPDSTWPGMTDAGRDVMEGYLIMGNEIARQIAAPPTHVFLQAGVGGLAASCAVSARATWGQDVTIVVVEPEDAPALKASIAAGEPVTAPGPVSIMGRLDCKEPSHLALKYLAREADYFVTISDTEAAETVDWLAGHDLATTASGAAGISAVHHAGSLRDALNLTGQSRVLCYLSEGPEDG